MLGEEFFKQCNEDPTYNLQRDTYINIFIYLLQKNTVHVHVSTTTKLYIHQNENFVSSNKNILCTYIHFTFPEEKQIFYPPERNFISPRDKKFKSTRTVVILTNTDITNTFAIGASKFSNIARRTKSVIGRRNN